MKASLGAVALAGGAVLAAGQWLGRTSGSTRAERRRRLPGDELVGHPTVVTNHAVTIPAPPDRVWPWLVQMGWHRAGWYTPRWVDRLLFPANWPSATRLLPELQRPLRAGGTIPDGPPGTAWFAVERVDPSAPAGAALHHPPARRLAGPAGRLDRLDLDLPPDRTGDGGTRLQLRVRGRTRPWWLTAAYVAALVPADHVMAAGMLAGIRRRVAPVSGWGPGGRRGS